MIVVVLLLLTLSIYFSGKWEDKKWKKIVSNSQIVLYSLYYTFLCWMIIESEQKILKDYLFQTYFVCTSIWNQLYCMKYRYQMLFIYQIGLLSISLAVSQIFEDTWTYVLNVSAFLILLFTVEKNGKFVQEQLQQNTIQQQQEQFLINNQEGLLLKCDKNNTRHSVCMQQQQSCQPTEYIIYNFDQSLNFHNQLIDKSLKRVNANSFGTPINKLQTLNNKINQENKRIRFQDHISIYNQQNIPMDFESNENILRDDEIISHENSIYKSVNQSKELEIFNNQINMNLVKQQSQQKVASEKVYSKDDTLNYIFSKKVSFNGQFSIDQRQKNNSQDSNKSQSSKLIRREIQVKKNKKIGSHQTIQQLTSNNSLIKHSKNLQKESHQQIENQNQQKKTQENQENQQNTLNDKNIKQNSEQQQNILKISDTQINLISNKENNANSEQSLPITPWLPSKSSDISNLQQHYSNNINKILQNEQQQSSNLSKQNQQTKIKLPSFSNLKNELNFLQKFCEDSNPKQDAYTYNNDVCGENNKEPSDDNIQQTVQQDNAIDFKLTFNDFQKNQQALISNTPKTPPRVMNRSMSQNSSKAVRQKLNELEKISHQTSDYFIASEKLINYSTDNNDKCAFCLNIIRQRQISKSKSEQNYSDNNKNIIDKSKSIHQDQIEENIKRIHFENIIYNKIDCGIIFLDQNISIIYANKQIHNFFHQLEVNDNLTNCLKLVSISDQSITTLKQFLLSSNKLSKQRNIQEINQAKMKAIWSLNQINEFLNKLNNQFLKENPVTLKWFLQRIFEIFCSKELKEFVNDLVIEVFQVIFSQKSNDQLEIKEDQNGLLFMSVQFKIHFYYNSETQEYQSFISIVNTGQRDLSLKKQISETLSYRIFQTLSHEFGTYMNIISNITENALEDDRVPIDLKKDYFRIINTNSLLLENLIKDMRHFFQIMNQKLEINWNQINLKETIFQTLELFKKQFQLKKLKVSIKIQKGIQQLINSDGQFIKQILSNLISNSLKFTLSGQIKVFLFKHSNRYCYYFFSTIYSYHYIHYSLQKYQLNFYSLKLLLYLIRSFKKFFNSFDIFKSDNKQIIKFFVVITLYQKKSKKIQLKKSNIFSICKRNLIIQIRYLRLEVEDSGIGMSNEEGEKLKGMLKNGFTDQKISKNSVGLGFGLLISNNLARMIGNPQKKQAIYFQSQPKEGSKFWILINQCINTNNVPVNQIHNKNMIFFSKQYQESQMKSQVQNTSGLINNTQIRVQGVQNKNELKRNKQNLLKSKSLTFNMNKHNKSQNSSISNREQFKKGEKSSPQLERILSNSCIQIEGDSQKPENKLLRKVSQLSTSMMKKSSTNKLESKNSNSQFQSPNLITEYRKSSFHIQNPQLQDMEINKNPHRMLKQSRTATIMLRDKSSQNFGVNEEHESCQNIPKRNNPHTCEKDVLKRVSKRNSTYQTNFNINTQYSLPNKLQKKNSINVFGSIPSQGLTNESSQMISSKIIQIRSRVKHTITNKSLQSTQQLNSFHLNQVNGLSVNVSEQFIDDHNKNNQQISKPSLTIFETPNFFKIGVKNANPSLDQSNIGLGLLEVQKKESLLVPQYPNKLNKESLNSISQSNQQLQRSSIWNQSNMINSQISNQQNSKQQTSGSLNNQNTIEQSNKRFQQIKKDIYSNRSSLESNLLLNNPQLSNKQQLILINGNAQHSQSLNPLGEFNEISQISQPQDSNREGEQQYFSQNKGVQSFSQNKSSKYLEQRIVEELFEDDKNNNSSENNSSNNNDNTSDFSSFSNTPKSNSYNSNSSTINKQKQGGIGNTSDKTQLPGFTSYYQSQAANQMRKLSISTTLKKNEDSDQSQMNTTNNSVSIEFIVQRDVIDYSDYEFDENHSLDDLDQTMHNQYKTIFKQNTTQSQFFPTLKNVKAFSSQPTSNSVSKQMSSYHQNVEKSLNEVNATDNMNAVNDTKIIKFSKCFDVQKIQEEQTENKNSEQTCTEYDDEENNKFTIPSERKLQKTNSIEQYDLSRTLISKCKLNIESRDLIQIQNRKMINTELDTKIVQHQYDYICNNKNIDCTTSIINNDKKEILQSNDRKTSILVQSSSNQRLPSITFNLKHQKNSSFSSIQDQKLFSFGVDDKLSGGETTNQQITQISQINQTIDLGEGKNIQQQRLSLTSQQQKQNSQHHYSQYFSKIPFASEKIQISPSSEQQLNAQQQHKIILDQNTLQSNQTQQQTQQTRFNSSNQLRSYSNHTLSNINAEEYDEKQPTVNNNNNEKLYLNTHLQNLQSQKKILIVDDEIFNIYSLKLIFSKFGLKDHILEAYNGQQAIDQIMSQQNIKSKRNNELGNQVGMIIMDVNMPIMNGIECTKYIRELECNSTLSYSPNIIGYTAYSDSETRDSCYEAGMDDLLLKPSRRDDFISILEKYYVNC